MDYAQLIQGSCAGEPGSFCGRSYGRLLEWASCLPGRVEEFEEIIIFAEVLE
jgi:hypothetical protein